MGEQSYNPADAPNPQSLGSDAQCQARANQEGRDREGLWRKSSSQITVWIPIHRGDHDWESRSEVNNNGQIDQGVSMSANFHFISSTIETLPV